MQDQIIYQARRKELLKKILAQNPDKPEGIIFLASGFDKEKTTFRQESSFYYLTGITESGVFLIVDFSGKSTLYIPKYSQTRSDWVLGTITPEMNPVLLGVDKITYLGENYNGFSLSQLFSSQEVSFLLKDLQQILSQNRLVYTLCPDSSQSYVEHQITLLRLAQFLPELQKKQIDISSVVASMRRVKSRQEIDLLYKAIEYTMVAHNGVSQLIEEGKKESELQATIEYLFTETGGKAAFPSIIASGKNSTVLHYHQNNNKLKKGELVVIDIGAELDYYCADITRTYPVSGIFSKRQREVYSVVLATQKFVASQAKPGYFIKNNEQPEKSLQHLALQFLRERGYETYFTHGIGHFLGLDVHDVGNVMEPLQVGDVITIEPGIYMPRENIGIRIEDDYHILKDGALCMSKDLPKEIDLLQQMMQEDADEEEDE